MYCNDASIRCLRKKVYICLVYCVTAMNLRVAGGISIGSLTLGNSVAVERIAP